MMIGEKMKNLKISKKLMVSYAIVMVLLILSIAVSIWNLVSIGKKVETFYNGPFMVSNAANVVNERFEGMQKAVYRAIANESVEITNQAIADAKSASETIQKNMPIIKEHFLGEQSLVTELSKKLEELQPMREEVLTMAAENRNAEAAAYMEKNNIPTIKEAQAVLDELIQDATDRGETLIKELSAAQIRSIIILSILGFSSLLISVLFAGYITRSITKPVNEIEEAADGLSKGKLDFVIEYRSEDELGHLAESMRKSTKILADMIHDVSYLVGEIASGNFNVKTRGEHFYVGEFRPMLMSLRDMNSNLSNTVGQINESSEQVSIGSGQMAENAQSLAEGATEQAGAVEELNATIEDVANRAEESAKDTLAAYQQIKQSVEQAEEGTQEMERLKGAMERINTTSQEIRNIIAAIEDIATQTNLLSLNASIEAARAGEAGRGFAVVADQIGKLASDSAQSAVDTRELIGKTLSEIEVGNGITMKTSEVFAAVIQSMQEFADVAQNTSKTSTEQASSLMEVRAGIEQISGVVQSNSAAAEEASATSEELAAQADNLKTLVSHFKLKQN